MSPEGVPYPSLSDFFHDRGLPVGVVTLGNIADATPTAFYGHSVERDNADELTRCLMDGRIDLLCGSGIREFTRRKDGIDLVGELEKQYDFVRSVDGIDAAKGKVICIDEAMDDAAEEANLTLLADATRASIAKLQERGGDGFFLMVEGAKIDYAGHSRCLPGSIIEMLSFDLAVAEALKFADTNGETLVIVTADHETGGLVVVDGDEHTGRVTGVYVSDDHTPAMLPVFAYGPGRRQVLRHLHEYRDCTQDKITDKITAYYDATQTNRGIHVAGLRSGHGRGARPQIGALQAALQKHLCKGGIRGRERVPHGQTRTHQTPDVRRGAQDPALARVGRA